MDIFLQINEHFAERHVLYVLYHLAVQIGDVAAAAQMVGMVVELEVFVGIAFMEVVLQCLCHGTSRILFTNRWCDITIDYYTVFVFLLFLKFHHISSWLFFLHCSSIIEYCQKHIFSKAFHVLHPNT